MHKGHTYISDHECEVQSLLIQSLLPSAHICTAPVNDCTALVYKKSYYV